ncbi:MAG: hypothetical protein EZS28_027369 [Streblomastix strix]|uniref:Uncharacterized protein n=1 Tax=Streblomastix strix TaxID=222440 RepID=A0A5J4V3M4_9EUKA|nr:MAG: hypothetical protein EZS28_027369 [Streblomastix strix]
MAPKLPKRNIKALVSRRSSLSLAALILACIHDFPGQPTLPARDYGVTLRKVYDVTRYYFYATQYTEEHTKYPIEAYRIGANFQHPSLSSK